MINRHVGPGIVLMCDFSGFRVPEMVKTRMVVVLSPRRRRTGRGKVLYTVVPLSTVEPGQIEPYHHRMDPQSLPVSQRSPDKDSWAKCDMVNTVSSERLTVPQSGGGIRETVSVTQADFKAIRGGVAIALGMVLVDSADAEPHS